MATYDAGEVRATMTADSSGLHGGVEAAKKDMQSLQDEAKRVKDSWRDMGLAAGVSFTAIMAGISKATQANNQMKASMMGLDSIAKGTIGTYPKIQAELEKIREDGMIPLTNAVAAYKNLLSRYQDEDTAIKMFNKIADAAAFGRSAHLSLGDAIQGTTEGLRNENSALTDNGGITKNLSVMWKEYAAQIGKTVGQLTEAEKKQAEVNGFMKEGRFQTGDLAKLQASLAGQMAKANAETTQASAAFGDVLKPALAGAVGGYSAMMKNIREFIQTSPGMVAGITAGATAMTGLVSVSSAWIALDMGTKIANGFKALTGPVGLTLIGLSALASVIVGINTHIAKMREEQAKLADTYRDQTNNLSDLIDRYETLSNKANKTAEEKKELRDVSYEIAKMVPDSVKAYDREAGAVIDLTKAVDGLVASKTKELEARKKLISSERTAELKNQSRILKEMKDTTDHYYDTVRQIKELTEEGMIGEEDAKTRIENLKLEHQQKIASLREQMNTSKKIMAELAAEESKLNERLSNGITRQTIRDEKTNPTTPPETIGGSVPVNQEAISSAEDLNQLQERLMIERLNRQKRYREAEISEELARYAEERKLAEGNVGLLEQIEQNHKERLAAIDEKYSEQERLRNQELTDEIIRMTGTKAEQEELYIKRHAEQMERDGYNFKQIEDWKTAYRRQKLQEQAAYEADWIASIITRQRTLKDWWRELMNNLVREYVQNFLLKIKAANAATGSDTSFWGAIFSAIGSLFGGGAGAAAEAGAGAASGATIPAAAKGMIVPAAANGMIVPPSFGTDKVLSALTPKEMVLPPDISEGLQNLIRQGSQPQIVNNNITNNYIDAIDQQSVAQFFYKNRDHVVGIIQDNQRRGGVLRQSEK